MLDLRTAFLSSLSVLEDPFTKAHSLLKISALLGHPTDIKQTGSKGTVSKRDDELGVPSFSLLIREQRNPVLHQPLCQRQVNATWKAKELARGRDL